jgi:hypothetical protein
MSQKYIYFTEEQKRRAHQTDIAKLLSRQGEKLKPSGSEYQWMDGSQKVTIRGNLWYHQYDQEGGDAISFVRRFYNKSYPEAIEYLLGEASGTLSISAPVDKKNKPFELPKRNDNMRRVFAYLLNKRNIDRSVLEIFAHKKMIFESAKYHNAVFVGYDEDGIPRHANMRGIGVESNFKGNAPNSMPEYSFHWKGKSEKLFLFESPIDLLSFISMNKEGWQNNNYAASCGVSDKVLFKCLENNLNIKKVFMCFDNDDAGKVAMDRIKEKLFIKGIEHKILAPIHKDWNEDLLFQEETEMNEPCQVL